MYKVKQDTRLIRKLCRLKETELDPQSNKNPLKGLKEEREVKWPEIFFLNHENCKAQDRETLSVVKKLVLAILGISVILDEFQNCSF